VFAKLSGAPVTEKKREPDGERKRLSILSRFIPGIRAAIEHSDIKKQQAAADDLIDAASLAVAARLSLSQPLLSVPEVTVIEKLAGKYTRRSTINVIQG
jgi:predicted RNase H-like nuclease